LQGFAINSFNPFTVTFWSVFSLTQVHERGLAEPEAWSVYAGILLTIIITDTIKVLAARKLREVLQPSVILWVQRAGGVALGLFGVVLGLRVWW
jgi:threonine/homoserine/homoserine lactone efflux protein